MVGGKVALGLVSALVLAGTGYYWQRTNELVGNLTTADVISAPAERPADGAIDILMVGMDSRTDAQGNPLSQEQLRLLNAGRSDGENNTDTLIMIRIPNDGGAATGVSIPRDSYVEIPGYGKHKINSAYPRAMLRTRERLQGEGVTDEAELEVRSKQEGAKNLIATITKLTGASIDHYAEINLLGFYDITNAIGGIDVCLKEAVRDKLSGANFPAGPQNLQGAQALAFVRQRHGLPNGDIDRIARQQAFMSGMAKKIFSQDMLVPGSQTLDQLQGAVAKAVVLDKDWNIIEFAQQMMGFTGGNLQFKTIPHGRLDLKTPEDGDAVQIDPPAVRAFVSGLIGGGSSTSASPSQSTTTEAPKPTVTVFNASGRTGLAAEVSEAIAAAGFETGEPGNATTRKSTVVRHATGEEAAARAVLDALGGDYSVEPDPDLGSGKVTVLLGKDYEAPGQPLAGPRPLVLNGAAGQPNPPCVH